MTPSGTLSGYYLSSRRLVSDDKVQAFWVYHANADGSVSSDSIAHVYKEDGSWVYGPVCLHFRPILTLKENTQLKSGDGKSAETAYTFE